MRVEPLLGDSAPAASAPDSTDAAADFERVLDAFGSMLETAQSAEDAFANGEGSLQDAVYERARADVALSIATAAAGRTTQAIASIVNMQV
jgi:flagellar hook-basal body complex protein FliE